MNLPANFLISGAAGFYQYMGKAVTRLMLLKCLPAESRMGAVLHHLHEREKIRVTDVKTTCKTYPFSSGFKYAA